MLIELLKKITMFQFQYGLIVMEEISRPQLEFTSFNSNMVWLWSCIESCNPILRGKFQFQYGLIVILETIVICGAALEVSIPIWSDCDWG
jgi:hypothetical protein